jgi:hypothetical protein
LTLPAATDTLVGRATTDTLTNKTLTGAAMNGTVGATTPSTGAFTTLSATGNVTLGDASTDTLNVGNGDLVKDASGNLGLGVTPSAWKTTKRAINLFSANALGLSGGDYESQVTNNCYDASGGWTRIGAAYGAGRYEQFNGGHLFYGDAAGASGVFTPSLRMTLDNGGNLLVGTTSALNGAARLDVSALSGNNVAATFKNDAGAGQWVTQIWNAGTSGDNGFVQFATETSYAGRGSISYNRAGGLVAYNTTSDYRAKDISGPVTGSGTLIDSVPVYMGKMKGATQERPMFIAHEVPAYAHTGAKDAVDDDGKPVYQQMDTSALVPVMWAEIQSLRKRLAALESA